MRMLLEWCKFNGMNRTRNRRTRLCFVRRQLCKWNSTTKMVSFVCDLIAKNLPTTENNCKTEDIGFHRIIYLEIR